MHSIHNWIAFKSVCVYICCNVTFYTVLWMTEQLYLCVLCKFCAHYTFNIFSCEIKGICGCCHVKLQYWTNERERGEVLLPTRINTGWLNTGESLNSWRVNKPIFKQQSDWITRIKNLYFHNLCLTWFGN